MNTGPFDTSETASDAAGRKRAWRQTLRQRRQSLPAAERIAAAEAIVARVSAFPAFAQPGYVAGYWATGGELPLHVLQLRLRADQVWCLPCIQDDNTLKFAPWRPGDPLVANRYGIPEPDVVLSSQLDAHALSILLVPLLGFSRDGHRLGMGGGYYDRSLAFRQQAAAPPWLLGIGYAFQELPDLTGEDWDVGLDAVATPDELVICR
ncbi:5-formyltetrahydrofolate cyclo-ligase [Arenimonas oryziterrae]|uniref:5-formyltetrahydrofolate cyclo-ligase n=1 Tax=Arenimonas oryziterrae TaxID=498055 RepID=UPI00041D33B4|nr:5-formyltetrahydrofolate cyclo-ligase [Arenimonas oryziterrae]